MLFLPETPRYLTKTGERTKALKSLAFFRGLPVEHPSIAAEVSIIEASLETESNIGTGSYLSCWRPPFLKRQLTGCVLQALQQLSGSKYSCPIRRIDHRDETSFFFFERLRV